MRLRPPAHIPEPPAPGEVIQLAWYRAELDGMYRLRNVDDELLAEAETWPGLLEHIGWGVPSQERATVRKLPPGLHDAPLGEGAERRAAHARRHRIGDIFEGKPIEHVAVTSFWRVVLHVGEERVMLDADDSVLQRWPRDQKSIYKQEAVRTAMPGAGPDVAGGRRSSPSPGPGGGRRGGGVKPPLDAQRDTAHPQGGPGRQGPRPNPQQLGLFGGT